MNAMYGVNSKVIYYDPGTFRFIRRQERRRIHLRNRLRRMDMVRSVINGLRVLVRYSFVDLVEDRCGSRA